MEFLYKAYADSGEVEEGRVAAAGKEKRRMNSEAAGFTR